MQVPTSFPLGKRSIRIIPGGFWRRLRREICASCFFVGETSAWVSAKQTTALEEGIRFGAGGSAGDPLPLLAFGVEECALAWLAGSCPLADGLALLPQPQSTTIISATAVAPNGVRQLPSLT